MLKVGPLEFVNPVIVAPLAGISNAAFRAMMARFEPALMYTEMISDKALFYQNKKTLKMAQINEDEGRVNVQLFGDDLEALSFAARYVDQHTQATMIDINMGCPVPKVIQGNGGASLMRDPNRVKQLVETVVQATTKPVSVKIRTGWNDHEKNAVEVALAAQAGGASLLAIHGRTRAQMYRGDVDLMTIKAVKEALDIPVIGNGDIKTPEDAKKMIETTHVDGVMIGRAVLENPWIIEQTIAYLKTGTYTQEVSLDARFTFMKEHAFKLAQLKSEKLAVLEMRSLAAWYVKGLKDSTHFRKTLVQLSTFDTLINHINAYHEHLKQTLNKDSK